MNDYKLILDNEIYPRLSQMADAALPEFEFVDKGNQWVSSNTLHLSGIEGEHGKGKVTISKRKPYVIGDWREGTSEVINYLVDSTYHPRVTDFKSAVEYLADVTGVELIGSFKSLNWGVPKYHSVPKAKPETLFIPFQYFKQSLRDYDKNNFTLYLRNKFGDEKAMGLIQRFSLGTSNYWDGSTVFWLIDEKNRITGGQVILFDENCSTVKKPFRHNSWVHKAIIKSYNKAKKDLPDWLNKYDEAEGNKYPCLFGLPQMEQEPHKPIAIVESAKTAVIATACLPQYLWMAVGSLSYLNKSRLKSLKGKNITLYPDKGGYKKWKEVVDGLKGFANISISDLVERKGAPGSDLADYLLNYDWRDFQSQEEPTISETRTAQPVIPVMNEQSDQDALFPESEGWHVRKEEENEPPIKIGEFEDHTETLPLLESFFSSITIPTHTILLEEELPIDDPQKFINDHLSFIRNNIGREESNPYIMQLVKLENYFINQTKSVENIQ